jgi:hypothetical protein
MRPKGRWPQEWVDSFGEGGYFLFIKNEKKGI